MSTYNFNFIFGITDSSTQEEIEVALTKADREAGSLLQMNQRTNAQDTRLQLLRGALKAYFEKYGSAAYSTNATPPDYSVDSPQRQVSGQASGNVPQRQVSGGGTPANTGGQVEGQSQAPAPAQTVTAPQDNNQQQPRREEREVLQCHLCAYTTVFRGHFARHMSIHQRG